MERVELQRLVMMEGCTWETRTATRLQIKNGCSELKQERLVWRLGTGTQLFMPRSEDRSVVMVATNYAPYKSQNTFDDSSRNCRRDSIHCFHSNGESKVVTWGHESYIIIRMYASIEAVIHGPSLHVEKLYEDGSAKIDFARCSLLSLFSGSIDG